MTTSQGDGVRTWLRHWVSIADRSHGTRGLEVQLCSTYGYISITFLCLRTWRERSGKFGDSGDTKLSGLLNPTMANKKTREQRAGGQTGHPSVPPLPPLLSSSNKKKKKRKLIKTFRKNSFQNGFQFLSILIHSVLTRRKYYFRRTSRGLG